MKTTTLIVSAFCILFLILQPLNAQNEEVITYFNSTEFNGKVLLSWEIVQGNTCNGVQIYRSIDSVNFDKIGSIEGICGSTTTSIKYNFTDLFPVKNAINYYRLGLGGIGFSWLVNAEVIDVGENNFILRPNPINSTTELLFNNDSGKEYKLHVFGLDGTLDATYITTSEAFYLNQDNFSSGVHFFEISSEETNTNLKGKFSVP